MHIEVSLPVSVSLNLNSCCGLTACAVGVEPATVTFFEGDCVVGRYADALEFGEAREGETVAPVGGVRLRGWCEFGIRGGGDVVGFVDEFHIITDEVVEGEESRSL